MRGGWVVVFLGLSGCAGSAASDTADSGGIGSDAANVVESGAADSGADAGSDTTAPPAPPLDGGHAGVYDATGPAFFADGGWELPTYVVTLTALVPGANPSESVHCEGLDTLIASGCSCTVSGGGLVSSLASLLPWEDGGVQQADAGGAIQWTWTCNATSISASVGSTITATAECDHAH